MVKKFGTHGKILATRNSTYHSKVIGKVKVPDRRQNDRQDKNNMPPDQNAHLGAILGYNAWRFPYRVRLIRLFYAFDVYFPCKLVYFDQNAFIYT
jgi:hypothetical protein